MAGSPPSCADCLSLSASGRETGSIPGVKIWPGRAQRLGQPAGADQQVLGGFGHLRLLEGANALGRHIAVGLPHRFDDAALGDARQIILDRGTPADRARATACASRSAWAIAFGRRL